MIYYVDFSFSPFGSVFRETITASTLIRAYNEFKRIHKGQKIFVHRILSKYYDEYLLLNSKTII